MRKTTIEPTSNKETRQYKVLLGLVDHYIKTGKPVGSNTLKEAEFEDISSATIRNYFSTLEENGYLTQHHASGGRMPTDKAYKAYAENALEKQQPLPQENEEIQKLGDENTRELAPYLQSAAETLSKLTECAVFISAPRFDRDTLISVKIVPIDNERCVCILVSDFGVITTEVLTIENKMTSFSARRIEEYFHARLTNEAPPQTLDEEEEELAQRFYHEVMLRYLIGYANFTDPEIYRTGFSKLLSYQEFQDTLSIAGSLSLFENRHSMRLLLKDCSAKNNLQFWIGEDLTSFVSEFPNCAVIAAPYHINQQPAGAIGILGPTRLPYRNLFPLMQAFTQAISNTLTRSVCKFRITYRQPEPKLINHKIKPLIEYTRNIK